MFGALGGAVSWSIHLVVVYALLPIACLTGSGFVVHLMTLLFGGLAVAAIVVSWRGWHREDAGQAARWLGAGGIVLNALFLLSIVLEDLAAFVIDPCL